jgi:hypothetical protein
MYIVNSSFPFSNLPVSLDLRPIITKTLLGHFG